MVGSSSPSYSVVRGTSASCVLNKIPNICHILMKHRTYMIENPLPNLVLIRICNECYSPLNRSRVEFSVIPK